MKPEKNIEKKLWSCILIMLILFTILWLLTSCSVENELFKCDNDARIITGITEDGKKYTAITGCGYEAMPITPYDKHGNRINPDSSMIGEYKECRY